MPVSCPDSMHMLANFKWPTPTDDSDHKLIRDVIEYKCHLVMIPRDEQGPGYVFSVGLYLHFAHPEIVIFGLDHTVAGTAINDICSLVQKGRRFQNRDILDEILSNVSVMAIDVHPNFYREYLGTALWFYRSVGPAFPVLQIVWPDKKGHFPWDPEVDYKAKDLQPVLAY